MSAAKPPDPAPPDPATSRGGYQVLARRFRPKSFAELVGQQAIEKSLRSALSTGQVPHAFLFSGSRGVGKTTTARILARCLNCETGVTPEPCGQCQSCRSILEGSNGDVMEIDAASHNLVDDVRELRDRVGFASMGARYKVYILDEVHMLTRSAFNAFLKTLEEPPAGVVFILATTELHKVPETIRSRCQVLLFQRVDEGQIEQRLDSIARSEGLAIPAEVFQEIARSARGGMRDAETALERILPLAREKGADFGLEDYRSLVHRTGLEAVVEVVGQLLEGQAAPALRFADELVAAGVDEREALGEILEVLRALLLLKVDGADSGLVAFGGGLREALLGLSEKADTTRLDAMISAGLQGRDRIRRLDDRRLCLELSLLRMAEAGQLQDLAELIALAKAGRLGGKSAAGRALPAAGNTHNGAPSRPPAGGSLKGRLLALCAQRKGVLTRTLELCNFAEPDADGLVAVELQTDRKLHIDRLRTDAILRDLRAMLSELCGRDIQVQVRVTGAPGAVAAAHEAPKLSASVEPGPEVRKVLERFDGRVVNVERPDAGG